MKKLILNIACLICLALPITLQAQINRYLPGTWKDKVAPTVITDSSLLSDDFTILNYSVVCSFVLTPNEEEANVTYSRYEYRHIRINTVKASDSLTNIIITIRPNESINYMRGRIIKPNGEISELAGQMDYVKSGNGVTNGILTIDPMEPGSELEYETKIFVTKDFAGSEFFQSDYPMLESHFKILYPKKYAIRTVSRNDYPEPKKKTGATYDSYEASTGYVAPKKVYTYNYRTPLLKGIDFSLYRFVTNTERRRNDTLDYTWQQFGDEQFYKYFYLEKAEFAKLQKELDSWAFLKQQKSLPLLVYQIEHFIKNKYTILETVDTPQLSDITSILRNKYASRAGITKLMAAVFYMMQIRCQLMITADRDQVPLDSNIARYGDAKNVLLYFPDIKQAMAPGEKAYQTPYYPPMWSNIESVVCSDTLIDNVSKVKVSFMKTPLPDYASSGMRNETEIWLTDTPGTARLRTVQQFSGFADAQVKTVIADVEVDPKTSFNAFILLKPERNNIISVEPQNMKWSPVSMSAPFTLNSTYLMPSFALEMNGLLTLRTGALLAYQYQPTQKLPPAGEPVNLMYPCYFERKVIVHLPKGYKVKNAAEFNADLSNIDPNTGLKCTIRQDGNVVTIFMMEWYKHSLLEGKSRQAFDKIANTVTSYRLKDLVLEKE
ncbi:DUF3857 domain-containing protein [uncultured Chitinophaga sp.]|uniref:DUF3857 domain-containing protein n=1 Tax=uncultured Chitinophaga sp. TaxID=339340 RepID=UPI0025E7F9E4|nr:DUF3857 domain-containing protein [uncultured Chitinophaga sp.]